MMYFYPQRTKPAYIAIMTLKWPHLNIYEVHVVQWWRQCFIFILQEPFEYDVTEPTKSGSEHVQDSLFKMADEKDY